MNSSVILSALFLFFQSFSSFQFTYAFATLPTGGGSLIRLDRMMRLDTYRGAKNEYDDEARRRRNSWKEYTKKGEKATSDDATSCDTPWSKDRYEESLELYDRLMQCEDTYVASLIKESLHVLEGAYRLYGTDCVVGSYNGGKDAVVIMHLIRAAHARYHSVQRESNKDLPETPNRPRVIYFENKHEFPEVLSFLHETVDQYDLGMISFDRSHSFSEGLSILVEEAKPIPLAFVLGTRCDDPNAGSQGKFAPSSDWMPPFMRVNPVLHWTYGHVWHFLRLFHLPYCSLYDEGYTSLGSVKDTLPCPALARPQGGYWPAYMLRDYDQERAGRIPKKDKHETISASSSTTSLHDDERETSSLPPSIRSAAASSSSSSISENRPKTVGLIIIGDEILKGLTKDTNTHAAATMLRAHNVPLTRVVVVSDDLDDIVSEIQCLMRQVDVLITSGGVGPTHDDVTMKSVSTALSSPLAIHPEMVKLLKSKIKNNDDSDDGKDKSLSEAQMKMAMVPQNSKLRYFKNTEWPILQCRNIFILPGVPQFFEQKMALLAPHLAVENMHRRVSCKVVLSEDETLIVNALNEVVERHPHVSFGSYPFVSHPEYKTVVTLEGKDSSSQNGSNVGGGSFRRGRSITSLSVDGLSEGSASCSAAQSNSSNLSAMFTQEEMDLHVKLALADLLIELPEKSVLRVDNDDNLM